MAAWFGSKKEKEIPDPAASPAPEGGSDPGAENGEGQPSITITEVARQKLMELIRGAESPVAGIRLLAEATSPVNPQYSLAFVQQGEEFEDDTVIDFQDFKVYIDPDSLGFAENIKLDFISTGMGGGGFRIDKILPRAKLEGPLAEKVQRVIDEQINPALALHGGYVQLIDVQGDTVYIELGGGCRGCGMVDVTLKQGIEVMIKQNVPEVRQILDSTDHASGKNPYYQPSK
ncbi:MAG: NifU family protein [Calditrichaceae bacterium]|nr:NifU family protein [Calditrichia bacterium]NUQ42039.1 NifU family protein [Calditrichaceae bacterium]